MPSASQTWPVTPQKSVTTPPAAALSLRQALHAGGGDPSPVFDGGGGAAGSGQHASKTARTAACCLGARETLAADSAASSRYETGPVASRLTTEQRNAGTYPPARPPGGR